MLCLGANHLKSKTIDFKDWADKTAKQQLTIAQRAGLSAKDQQAYYDSAGVERRFAEELEANEAVRVYAKLPGWFKVPTPLGTYNPDWAVLIEDEGQERLYFVVETKGSGWWDDLRHKEGAKIACGKAHFAVLAQGENPAKYIHATSVGEMMKHS